MSGYMGTVKTKPELFLKLIKKVSKPEYTLHILENRNGQKAMFYNYKGESFDEGDCVRLQATIAEHRTSTYDGSDLTYLNHVTILENRGSLEKKPDKEIVENSFKERLRNKLNQKSQKQIQQLQEYGKE